jgi:aralkylamine N-acetyltransferase
MPLATLLFVERPDAACLKRIITLYKAQGWWSRKDNPAGLRRLIAGSHCFLLAEAGGELLGMGRAISDGAGDAYIPDVMVLPAARGTGLGRAIMRRLIRRLKADGINWIGLIAQDGSEAFYKPLGFSALKNAAPMLYKGSRV